MIRYFYISWEKFLHISVYFCVTQTFISYVQDLFLSISDKVAMYISVFLYTYLRQRTCLLFICLIWRSIIFEIKAINICMCNIWDREHTYHLYFMFQIDFWFSCGPQILKYLQEIQFQKKAQLEGWNMFHWDFSVACCNIPPICNIWDKVWRDTGVGLGRSLILTILVWFHSLLISICYFFENVFLVSTLIFVTPVSDVILFLSVIVIFVIVFLVSAYDICYTGIGLGRSLILTILVWIHSLQC